MHNTEMTGKVGISKYRLRLFFNFFFLFVAFAIAIGVFQFRREKEYRVGQLENSLITYNHLVNRFIQIDSVYSNEDFENLSYRLNYIPQQDIRLTVIDNSGEVLFDSHVKDYHNMENHLYRPEVQESVKEAFGTIIRNSATTKKDYYYLSINYNDYFIRTALPYTIDTANLLKADVFFIYIIALIFLITVVVLIYFSDRFGKSISMLHQFAQKAASGKDLLVHEEFPNNELGAIGDRIVEVYNRMQKAKFQLNAEKEKLYRHLQISSEGIAIFSRNKVQLLANNNFIQYLNMLSDETAVTPARFFQIQAMEPIISFIEERISAEEENRSSSHSSDVLTVRKGGKYFLVQAIVFNDLSFEISIVDVTKVEKEKILKQQMTSNIAHELKTPVSSIIGYLETILTGKVTPEKTQYFLERTHVQAQRLSALIQDISLLNKIEEAANMFSLEPIAVKEVILQIVDDLRNKMEENESSIKIDVDEKLVVNGNRPIFYSIWRNLLENAFNYAGKGASVEIKNYIEDDDFLYFSFADNGVGIDEKHLNRLFERFYRVDSGRSRNMGGTGLGLAIVKNGVQFHKGEISVKNLKGGGAEFVFSIKKNAAH